MRQTQHPILPASVCQYFFFKQSSACPSCRQRSGQLLYLNCKTLSIPFFNPGFSCHRPKSAGAFSGAQLSTKPGPACQYLFSSERTFSRTHSPNDFLRCARGTFIPAPHSLVNTFVYVFSSWHFKNMGSRGIDSIWAMCEL